MLEGGKKTSTDSLEKRGICERAGGISLISVSHTLKGYIIREQQSPFHISLCLSLPVLNPISITPSLPVSDFLFFMLHNGILRNLHLPSHPSSSSFPLFPRFVLYSLLFTLLHPPPPPSLLPCLSLSTPLYLITPGGPPCCDPGHR